MQHYCYDGPVMEFDRIIDNHWRSETYAVSEKQARNNFAYQYKRLTGRVAKSKITIPGKIILTEEEACK